MSSPQHIAIILDGNRRWAQQNNVPVWKGHHKGAQKVEKLLDWCSELGIGQVTLYCFSTENFNRSPKEKESLFSLFRTQFSKLWNEKTLAKNKIRMRVLGDTTLFPKDLQESFRKITKATEMHSKLIVNFALGYGSRDEIVHAAIQLAKKVQTGKLQSEDITQELFSHHLYLSDNPDLIIRPGGERRLSNFLLWQASYAELFFIDTLWPDFEKDDLVKVINEYQNREKRYGE